MIREVDLPLAASDASAYHASGTVLLAVHTWTFMLGPFFVLGVNTMMYIDLVIAT